MSRRKSRILVGCEKVVSGKFGLSIQSKQSNVMRPNFSFKLGAKVQHKQ